MNNVAKIGLVSVSDRASSGAYQDLGIPTLKNWLDKAILSPFQTVEALVPDEQASIEEALKRLVDEEKCDLVLTTGGTGPAKRDVTPEATLAVGTRQMPGFGEQMRAVSLAFVPTAILSRQTAVLRENSEHSALIINLPGQPKAIAETLEGLPGKGIKGIFAAVPYCIELIGGPAIETDPAVVLAFRPKSAARPAIIDALMVEPEDKKVDSAVIMLHGLGADADDFEHFRQELIACGAPLEKTRFILPRAPVRPITLNNGYPMRGWFDLFSLDGSGPEDSEGLAQTFQIIRRLIAEQQSRGIQRNRIFLGGFSQGGCMALYSALRLGEPIGGIFCLSGYLPLMSEKLPESLPEVFSPIFIGYGAEDPVVPPAFTQISAHRLSEIDQQPLFVKRYEGMQHTLCLEEVQDLADFLAMCLR